MERRRRDKEEKKNKVGRGRKQAGTGAWGAGGEVNPSLALILRNWSVPLHSTWFPSSPHTFF